MSLFKTHLEKLPKSELHLHLRGAIPISVFIQLFNKYASQDKWWDDFLSQTGIYETHTNIRPILQSRSITEELAQKLFHFQSFQHFLETYRFTGFFIHDATDFMALIHGVLDSLHRQNIVYAEITVAVVEYIIQGMFLEEIIDCFKNAITPPGIQVRWIIDLVRNIGHEAALSLVKEIIKLKCDTIIGITIGGSEHKFPPAPFAKVYQVARENGLRLSVHAGEALGAQSVWDAIDILNAERIGHGVRAIEDASLVASLILRGIPLEVCPTSNICTGIFPSYSSHPVKRLYDMGVPISINTDDPTFFKTTLVDEYIHLQELGFRDTQIIDLIGNGFRHAFLDSETITDYLETLKLAWESFTG